jgi:hypothetical protein
MSEPEATATTTSMSESEATATTQPPPAKKPTLEQPAEATTPAKPKSTGPEPMRVHVISLNLANANRDDTELDGKYAFRNRIDKIIQYLKNQVHCISCSERKYAVLICLQEVRRMKRADGGVELTGYQVADKIATGLGMAYVLSTNSPDPDSFHKMVLYHPDQCMVTHNTTIWTGGQVDVPSGPQRCCSIQSVRVIFKNDLGLFKSKFVEGYGMALYNCHAPVDEVDRDTYFSAITKLEKIKFLGYALFIGDFNTIESMGGKRQLQELREHFAVLPGITRHITNGNEVDETFRGFPYDCPKGSTEPYTGVFDHAFLCHGPPCTLETVSATPWQSDEQLSDHYPLHVGFILKSKVKLIE